MKKKTLITAFVPALVLALIVGLSAAPKASAQPLTVPLSSVCTLTQGTATTADDVIGTFTGTLTVLEFVRQGAQAAVRGTVSGTCAAAGSTPVTITNVPVTIPIIDAAQQAACQILDLTLGPLHLDLLGLVIDLSQIDLQITAVPGPGNLLGNLLCAIAGLLDGGLLNPVINILNNLLGRGLITVA